MNNSTAFRTGPLASLSRLLLDLHRASADVDAATFQYWALERLRQNIAFDSAMWATGAGTAQGPLFQVLLQQGAAATLSR